MHEVDIAKGLGNARELPGQGNSRSFCTIILRVVWLRYGRATFFRLSGRPARRCRDKHRMSNIETIIAGLALDGQDDPTVARAIQLRRSTGRG